MSDSRPTRNGKPRRKTRSHNDELSAVNRRLQSNVEELEPTNRNISERRRAEQQPREREAEIVHAQRLHAAEEIVASLAHDLGQPLAAIANEIGACIRFVQAKRIDPRILLEALEHAEAEAERAGSLLRRLRAGDGGAGGYSRSHVPLHVAALPGHTGRTRDRI
jgi:C4-dicarboxylate-specific signal transduction histidine kinase